MRYVGAVYIAYFRCAGLMNLYAIYINSHNPKVAGSNPSSATIFIP